MFQINQAHFMNRAVLVFSIMLISLNDLCAQNQSSEETSCSEISKRIEKQLLNKAEKGVEYKRYDEAIKNYSELLKTDPLNPKNNYAMALTLYTNFQQPKAIPYFERALQYSKDSITDARFFLAAAYHLSGNYDQAEKNYKTYFGLLGCHNTCLSKGEEENAKIDITHRIEMCENGKLLSSSSAERSPLLNEGKKNTISYIGSNLNNLRDDFGPVFSSNDSTLYFTSRRKDDGDIYFSRLGKNGWSKVKNIGWPINTPGYESAINLSADGKRIYFYRSGILDDAVYYSDFINKHWNFPHPLLTRNEIENTFKETKLYCFALTPSQNELYVISDRKGGLGGKDIYVSKKLSDSTWGVLENLGAPINTEYDETALSLSPDGNTMYFSSNGNKSIGGFDVFVSKRNKGGWSAPVNLGLPINTPGDDLFFSFLHNSNRAAYSSSAYADNSSRDLDIYFVDFCDEVKEITVKGITSSISNGTVTATDVLKKSNTAKGIIIGGQYSVNLKVGRTYDFVFETIGIKPVHSEISIPIPSECKRYDIYEEITFTKPGDTLLIKSALLDIESETRYPDISAYPAFFKQSDKTKLINYYEIKLPTYPSETTTITTVIYDTVSGKALSKVSFNNGLFDAEKNKIKEIYDGELAKAPASESSQAITTFSFNEMLFDFDKSEIVEISRVELDKAAVFLSQVKPDSQIEIAACADSEGITEHNILLSKCRAETIAAYLVSKKINRNNITVVGYGDAKPIAPNKNPDGTDNPEGKAKNRRTEIVIK